jgi:hypothetical protein
MAPSTLTPTQEQVLALLSAGSTLTAAAATTGIHRNTIANWRQSSPVFREALQQAGIEKAEHWREQAEELAALAIDAIRAILTGPKAPAGVRLKAALAILNQVQTPTVFSASASPRSLREPTESASEPDPTPATKRSECTIRPSQNPTTYTRPTPKTGRNDPCPCASGRKFKHCCMDRPHSAAA